MTLLLNKVISHFIFELYFILQSAFYKLHFQMFDHNYVLNFCIREMFLNLSHEHIPIATNSRQTQKIEMTIIYCFCRSLCCGVKGSACFYVFNEMKSM